jgi:hypothetical protein
MADRDAAFVGSIPQNYDRYLGPLFFHPYADDFVARLTVTERLAARLGERGTLVATDLNEPMIAYAQQRLGSGSRVEWRPADATTLPFEDASFDAVVCQFGLMCVPDESRGIREHSGFSSTAAARRTRRSSTRCRSARTTWVRCAAGFTPRAFGDVEAVTVEKVGTSPSAADAVKGLIDGNPIYTAIIERRADALGDIRAAVAKNVAAALGDRPVRAPLRAIVLSARKP